ncbi:hypothetical protein [Streptomyces sp. NBC_01462]|uniref:hypothetical protein n=1 Tax=Streptomyces sp. NBC_01462 TaxID=2903876 RepID=UPI002E357EAC|nr:hypothetical protein [Streptomyces sp. NBC_01462]
MNDKSYGCGGQEARHSADDRTVVGASGVTVGAEAVSVQTARRQGPLIRFGLDHRERRKKCRRSVVEGFAKGVATVVGASIARWLLSLL